MNDVAELNLKKLLEHAHIGVVIHRWDTSIVYANPTALKLLRLSHEQIIGKDAFDPQWSFVDDAGKKMLIEDYPVNKVKKSKTRLTNEVMGVVDSSIDEISWFMINAYPEQADDPDSSFIVVTFNDISDTKKMFSFEELLENTQDVVVVTEAENIDYPTGPKIVYVNHAFEVVTGYKPEDVIGETPRILQGSLTDKTAKQRISLALKEKQPVRETLLNYDVHGRPYWIEMNIIPLKNKYGEVTHFAAIERDVSEQKFHLEQLKSRNEDLKNLKRDLEKIVDERTLELQKAKSQLEMIAYFDPLTDIPNRRYFIDHTYKLIKSCTRQNSMIAFGLIDVDDFKALNDEHGHDAGDQVLIALASSLSNLFRADDAYCRYGGEEFAFALIVDRSETLNKVLDRLMGTIRGICIDLAEDTSVSITASVGVKLCDTEAEVDFEMEMKQADLALYQSKEDGKDKFTVVTS